MSARQQTKLVVVAIILILAPVGLVAAQSSTRNQIRRSRPAQPGSATRTRQGTGTPQGSSTRAASPKVAMSGYCAVCLREKGEWVRGRREHRTVYDGRVYYFPGPEQKQMFLANPVKYLPALNGDCTVCQVNMGQRVPGSVNFGVDYGGRFYFFPTAQQREMFKSNPRAYASADLALGGQCAVCRVEMKQNVPGRDEFAVMYGGMRYLFPGPEQMKMFQANPAKYATASR